MSYLFTKNRKKFIRKAMPDARERNRVLRELRAFLDENEPELVFFLVNTWRTQARAITYKELREAIISGDISWDVLEEWQEDYAAFVTKHMRPAYENAIKAAAKKIEETHPGWFFDPMADAVREWTSARAAKFVTETSATQLEGIRTVIHRAAALENMTVDQLARAIRPMIGLTDPQAKANMRYFEKLLENGASEKNARELASRYAARQHRYRAQNIARTELATAYNQGAYEGTRQAQEKGYMGDCVKIWSTADDERVCKICGGLEGQRVGLNEPFSFRTRLSAAEPRLVLTPPAHPSCRCAYMIKEITPPIIPSSVSTT